MMARANHPTEKHRISFLFATFAFHKYTNIAKRTGIAAREKNVEHVQL